MKICIHCLETLPDKYFLRARGGEKYKICEPCRLAGQISRRRKRLIRLQAEIDGRRKLARAEKLKRESRRDGKMAAAGEKT